MPTAILSDNSAVRSRDRLDSLVHNGGQRVPPRRWVGYCFPEKPGQQDSPAQSVEKIRDRLSNTGSVFLLVVDVHYKENDYAGLEHIYPQLLDFDPSQRMWHHVAIFSAYFGYQKTEPRRVKLMELIDAIAVRDSRVSTENVFGSPDESELRRFGMWANGLPGQ